MHSEAFFDAKESSQCPISQSSIFQSNFNFEFSLSCLGAATPERRLIPHRYHVGTGGNRQPGFRRGLVEQNNAEKNNPVGWLADWLLARAVSAGLVWVASLPVRFQTAGWLTKLDGWPGSRWFAPPRWLWLTAQPAVL